MSDEAGNAGTQAIVDSFKAANEAKAKLQGTMRILGESLAKFAEVLKHPENYRLEMSTNYIAATDIRERSSRPAASVNPSQVDWKALCETLEGYSKAREDKKLAADVLRSMGLPISDD